MEILEQMAANGFYRVADAQNSHDNRIKLLRDGPVTYPAWLAAIAAAKNFVHLENYIIQEDAVGAQFAEALRAAAGRGVRCRVLYDWLGCLTRTSRGFWSSLRAAGVEVRRYNPPHLSLPFRWVSRDHRKVLCVDNTIAFTGGLCIGHDWAGDPAKGIAPWRDTAIQIEGPAVAQINAAFADSWATTGAAVPAVDLPASGPSGGDDIHLSVIAGRPRDMGLYRVEQLIAEIVDHSLWLTDGYFVATTFYVRALCGAARAGVDVRLLVPGSSNWPAVGALSKASYRPLLQAGVRVFEWNGPMLHAKTAVADGCWSRIGSSNSNLASWVSNRELDVTIKDTTLADQMRAMFEQDMENATEVVLRRRTGGLTTIGSATDPDDVESGRQAGAGRLLSGAIGLGSTLGATLNQHRTLGSADALVLSGGGGGLLLLALIAIFLPRFVAYPLAFIALWFAIGFLTHAFKLWRNGHDRTGEQP